MGRGHGLAARLEAQYKELMFRYVRGKSQYSEAFGEPNGKCGPEEGAGCLVLGVDGGIDWC